MIATLPSSLVRNVPSIEVAGRVVVITRSFCVSLCSLCVFCAVIIEIVVRTIQNKNDGREIYRNGIKTTHIIALYSQTPFP